MSKPPSAASVLKNLKKQSYAPVTKDIAGNFIIPNLSGITSNIDANNKLGAIYATNAALAAHIALAQAHSDYLINNGNDETTGTLTMAGLSAAANTDITGIIGRAHVGLMTGLNDYAGFCHFDQNSNTAFALAQAANGVVILNSIQQILLRIGSSTELATLTATLFRVDQNLEATKALVVDTNKLVVNAAGYTDKVGIGTASPDVSLDVKPAGVAEVKIAANGNLAKLYLERYGTSVRKYSIYTGLTQSLRIKDETAVADRLTIDAAGNVGIGTSSPGELLEVSKSQNTDTSILIKNENVGATAIAGLGIKTDGANVGILWKYGSGYTNNIFGSSRANNLVLATQNANDDLMIGTIADANVIFGQNNAEVMRIDTAGNVGIGTTTPAGALDVTSTTGGFIVPRMTTAQVAALTPVNGMIVYDLTLNKFQFYENGAWVSGSGLV